MYSINPINPKGSINVTWIRGGSLFLSSMTSYINLKKSSQFNYYVMHMIPLSLIRNKIKIQLKNRAS